MPAWVLKSGFHKRGLANGVSPLSSEMKRKKGRKQKNGKNGKNRKNGREGKKTRDKKDKREENGKHRKKIGSDTVPEPVTPCEIPIKCRLCPLKRRFEGLERGRSYRVVFHNACALTCRFLCLSPPHLPASPPPWGRTTTRLTRVPRKGPFRTKNSTESKFTSARTKRYGNSKALRRVLRSA